MINRNFILFLACFSFFFMTFSQARADIKGLHWVWPTWNWSKPHQDYRVYKKYNPYLEEARHLQIPQWGHKDWYVEDWTEQQDGMTLIKGFYAADILRDQTMNRLDFPILVVGPNFYRLSGFDKRRVVTTVNTVYGMTEKTENASFTLTDWNTKMPVGIFDKHGLRLH